MNQVTIENAHQRDDSSEIILFHGEFQGEN